LGDVVDPKMEEVTVYRSKTSASLAAIIRSMKGATQGRNTDKPSCPHTGPAGAVCGGTWSAALTVKNR
jgi:hypothetical protein